MRCHQILIDQFSVDEVDIQGLLELIKEKIPNAKDEYIIKVL